MVGSEGFIIGECVVGSGGEDGRGNGGAGGRGSGTRNKLRWEDK